MRRHKTHHTRYICQYIYHQKPREYTWEEILRLLNRGGWNIILNEAKFMGMDSIRNSGFSELKECPKVALIIYLVGCQKLGPKVSIRKLGGMIQM